MLNFVFIYALISGTILFSLIPAAEVESICQRTVQEFLLPKAEQTHEIFYILGKNILLITQFSNSKLLKAKTAPGNGNGGIREVMGFTIGEGKPGLHGLTPSFANKGKFWVSQEIENKLILLDPVIEDLKTNPKILKTIDIPKPGNGPHHIAEYGPDIWATLKVSEHVLRIKFNRPSDYTLYKAHPTPVFLAQHPISMDIYASEYKSNSILRINSKTNATSRIQVPRDVGESPVGLVSDGKYTWVALLSIQSKGTGSFGKIYSNGTVEWFKLKTKIGQKAALLHIAFDPDDKTEPRPGVWLLGSSVEDDEAFDMIVRAHFDKDFERFDREEIVILPSQGIKAHRISASRPGLYVTELTSSRVAFFKRSRSKKCDFTFANVLVNEKDEI